MTSVVSELMSGPALTCAPATTLDAAAVRMREAGVGSIVVTDAAAVAGILTERDLLRATAAGAVPSDEPVDRWMTAGPDVLAPGDAAGAALDGLVRRHYRHLPVVDGSALVGMVSLRDLVTTARDAGPPPAARGLEGVVAAETSVGSVRGEEGFYHYRQYSAVELAGRRSLEDVWHLLVEGDLPGRSEAAAFADRVAGLRALPPGVARLLPGVAQHGSPMAVLRTAVSLLGAELGWPPVLDCTPDDLRAQTLRLCAVVPTVLAATYRLQQGQEPIEPRADLPLAANYLWMLGGTEPSPEVARALEQYLVVVVDHGFNASTFAARVIASTGADLGAAICGAIGALSGPLHGGAPSRALDMLDEIGSPERAEAWIRAAVARGERIMGFGHRVYRTEDPRAVFLRSVAAALDEPLATFAGQVERTAVEVLAEHKPGRRLYSNVELYAGVVQHACGVPRAMFTPTFTVGRCIGWSAHVLEQAAARRLIRPLARYVGPEPPVPVPAP